LPYFDIMTSYSNCVACGRPLRNCFFCLGCGAAACSPACLQRHRSAPCPEQADSVAADRARADREPTSLGAPPRPPGESAER
jgi:hypothetical protein